MPLRARAGAAFAPWMALVFFAALQFGKRW